MEAPFNPAHVAPDAPGIYEMRSGFFRYYDGKAWHFGGSTKQAAENARRQAIPDECRQPWRIPE